MQQPGTQLDQAVQQMSEHVDWTRPGRAGSGRAAVEDFNNITWPGPPCNSDPVLPSGQDNYKTTFLPTLDLDGEWHRKHGEFCVLSE